MRTRLRPFTNQTIIIRATVEGFGNKTQGGKHFSTVLLKDLTNSKRFIICDHLWVEYSPYLKRFNLQSGDRIKFNATVFKYQRKSDNSIDFGLRDVSSVVKLVSSINYAYMG